MTLSLKERSDKPFGLPNSGYSSIYILLTRTHLTHVLLIARVVTMISNLGGKAGPGH